MRRLLPVLAIAATAAVATPALAAPYYSAADENPNYAAAYAVPATGAVVGTVVGVGLYNAWWGSGALATALPATAAGAAAVGGVAGVGTIVLIDAVTERCRGFQALLTMNRDQCVNGEYVGYRPGPPVRHLSIR
jgi:hypothetical protein